MIKLVEEVKTKVPVRRYKFVRADNSVVEVRATGEEEARHLAMVEISGPKADGTKYRGMGLKLMEDKRG